MNLLFAFLMFAAAVVSIPAGAGPSPQSLAAEVEALSARIATLEGNIAAADPCTGPGAKCTPGREPPVDLTNGRGNRP